MYTEEYERRGFPFRDFLLKLILVILFALLLVWLLPKFVSPKISNCSNNESSCVTDLSPLTNKIFADNLEKMKEAAITYYTEERLPKEVDESDTMTLSDMIGKKLLVPLIDKNGKACDVEKSYVKITKMDNEYLLKVNLKSSDEEDYILVHLGCYNYCDSYVCEKQTNIATKSAKPTSTVGGSSNTSVNNNSTNDNNNDSTPSVPTPGEPEEEIPEKVVGYEYEYSKTSGAEFSIWSKWTALKETDCIDKYKTTINTFIPYLNCSDDSIDCLKRTQLYNRKVKAGTYTKKYVTSHDVVKQVTSYKQKSCSKYNYVIIDNITYATTTTTTYSTINGINASTASSVGGWVYQGRAVYTAPPKGSSTVQYVYVGASYDNCGEVCQSIPYFIYDKYTYSGGLTKVSNTTSTSTSTSSSSDISVSASCGEVVEKEVPVYRTITVSEIAEREEPKYEYKCYITEQTRTLLDAGKTLVKWSKYNDTELLEAGYHYTGAKREKK